MNWLIRKGKEGTYSVPQPCTDACDESDHLLPNDWTHYQDGSIAPPDMSSIFRTAAVNETLLLTFPSRLEAFGLSQHQASTPLMDSEDDNDFDDTDVANSDSDADSDADSDNSCGTKDSSENFEEEEGNRDDLVATIQSQRDQVGTKNPKVAKENRYMTPSHHDFDIRLGGTCAKKCKCKNNMTEFVSQLKRSTNVGFKSSNSCPSTPACSPQESAKSPLEILGPVVVDLSNNNFSPKILESISGKVYSTIGEPDTFAVIEETIQINPSFFAAFFYPNTKTND